MHILIKEKDHIIGDVEVGETMTISDLKALINDEFNLNAETIVMIYAGKVLTDEISVKSSGISDNSSVFIVYKLKKKNMQKQPPEFSKQKPKKSLKSKLAPAMLSIIENNPDFCANMMKSIPNFESIAEQNPELKHALNDPEMMKEQLQMFMHPENKDQSARVLDRMFDTVESIPGGFNALQHHMSTLQDPLMDSLFDSIRNPVTPTIESERPDAPSDEPLPVMQRHNHDPLIEGLQAKIRMTHPKEIVKQGYQKIIAGIKLCKQGGFNVSPLMMGQPYTPDPFMSSAPSKPEKATPQTFDQLVDRFQKQLHDMQEMGFEDIEKNVNALLKTNGNVTRAINMIIEGQI